eukprot:gene8755-9909_t
MCPYVSIFQGVAAAFAKGGTTAVFTVVGSAGVSIARWSRFAREKELLYPPNSKFIVDKALSKEQAEILGHSGMQIFELTHISELGALSVFLRQLTAKVALSGGGDGVAVIVQLYEVSAPVRRGEEAAQLGHPGRPRRGAIGSPRAAAAARPHLNGALSV